MIYEIVEEVKQTSHTAFILQCGTCCMFAKCFLRFIQTLPYNHFLCAVGGVYNVDAFRQRYVLTSLNGATEHGGAVDACHTDMGIVPKNIETITNNAHLRIGVCIRQMSDGSRASLP